MGSNHDKGVINEVVEDIERRNTPPDEINTKAREEADRVLKTGNPITYILDVFNKIHIGDRGIGEVLILSSGSACISNCQGIHPKLSGESGKGKSHSCKTMIHLMPSEYVMNTSLSAKAIFYHGETLKPGSILFSDDIELSTDLESIIKRSTSEFQQGIEHHTVDLKRKAQTLKMSPRVLWWLASVDSELDMQTLNRQLGVNVDDSTETDSDVMRQQIEAAITGKNEYPETFEVHVCREIFRSVKEKFVTVTIPFAGRIEWRGAGNRRNLPIFLDMVKVYAMFHYMQREVITDRDSGFEIRATEEDFNHAAVIYSSRAKAQTNKLNEAEMKIMDFLASYGAADINTIAKYIKLPYARTRQLLVGRSDRATSNGLLSKVKKLTMSRMQREADGGKVTVNEFHLDADYNIFESYSNVVSLKGG